jgi:calcium-dependent protein kinase
MGSCNSKNSKTQKITTVNDNKEVQNDTQNENDNEVKKTKSNIEKDLAINSKMFVGKSQGLPTENYILNKKLGEGSYGVVWKVKHILTGHDRAMKKINKTVRTNNETEIDILNEIEILKKMDHPNIVKIFEFYSTLEGYFLITEYCTGGELFDEISQNAPFSELRTSFIMYQIFSAVNYCHKSNIIHRDLKPENILIESVDQKGFYQLKIIDFGTAKLYERNKSEKKIIGSSYYIAPEVLNKNYNEKCDLWSCGVILYILISGRAPFSGEKDSIILEKIKIGKYDLSRSPFNKISAECKDLIRKLLEVNPKKRISASEALQHTWFAKQNIKKIFTNVNEELLKITIDNLLDYNPEHKLQQVVLGYLVHNFPQIEEIKEINKIFHKFDENNDGRLTKEEMTNGLIINLKENQNNAEAIVDEIFGIIDSDQNGYIEFEEFIRAGIDKRIFIDEEILRFAFDYFDKDGSGSITIKELKHIFCVDNDLDYTERLMKEVMRGIDTDGNGEISFTEFVAMMDKILQ